MYIEIIFRQPGDSRAVDNISPVLRGARVDNYYFECEKFYFPLLAPRVPIAALGSIHSEFRLGGWRCWILPEIGKEVKKSRSQEVVLMTLVACSFHMSSPVLPVHVLPVCLSGSRRLLSPVKDVRVCMRASVDANVNAGNTHGPQGVCRYCHVIVTVTANPNLSLVAKSNYANSNFGSGRVGGHIV